MACRNHCEQRKWPGAHVQHDAIASAFQSTPQGLGKFGCSRRILRHRRICTLSHADVGIGADVQLRPLRIQGSAVRWHSGGRHDGSSPGSSSKQLLPSLIRAQLVGRHLAMLSTRHFHVVAARQCKSFHTSEHRESIGTPVNNGPKYQLRTGHTRTSPPVDIINYEIYFYSSPHHPTDTIQLLITPCQLMSLNDTPRCL